MVQGAQRAPTQLHVSNWRCATPRPPPKQASRLRNPLGGHKQATYSLLQKGLAPIRAIVRKPHAEHRQKTQQRTSAHISILGQGSVLAAVDGELDPRQHHVEQQRRGEFGIASLLAAEGRRKGAHVVGIAGVRLVSPAWSCGLTHVEPGRAMPHLFARSPMAEKTSLAMRPRSAAHTAVISSYAFQTSTLDGQQTKVMGRKGAKLRQ
mmetsp:Transcript_125120/g.400751  ORF Transcript_125120/g.400751 Transcript_125120/m.400751 type:complete len:207 (-) Transcript_125120:659-1279(-)